MNEQDTTPQPVESKVAQIEEKIEAPIEAKTEETTPEVEPEVKPEEKKEDRLSSRFAALNKLDRTVKEREKAIVQREQTISEKEKKYAEWERIEKGAQADPFAVLKLLGIDLNTLNEKWLVEQTISPQDKKLSEVEERIAAFEREKAEYEVQSQAQKVKEATAAYFKSLNQIVQSNDQFELIRQNGEEGINEVITLQTDYLKEYGKMLDDQEALDLVEKAYEDEAKKYVSAKKIKSLFGQDEQKKSVKLSETKTLTNEQTTKVPSAGDKPLSEEERYARALAVLQSAAKK